MPQARHPKAASFVRQKLFADVTNFADLESRITALPDERARGDAFEVFAEAFLATHRKHDAAAVWPLSSVPSSILQNLGLAAQDYGVDGVFQTLLGNFNAYQVKFRTGRPALTWPSCPRSWAWPTVRKSAAACCSPTAMTCRRS